MAGIGIPDGIAPWELVAYGVREAETGMCEIGPPLKNQSQTERKSLELEGTSGANRQFSTSETSKIIKRRLTEYHNAAKMRAADSAF